MLALHIGVNGNPNDKAGAMYYNRFTQHNHNNNNNSDIDDQDIDSLSKITYGQESPNCNNKLEDDFYGLKTKKHQSINEKSIGNVFSNKVLNDYQKQQTENNNKPSRKTSQNHKRQKSRLSIYNEESFEMDEEDFEIPCYRGEQNLMNQIAQDY